MFVPLLSRNDLWSSIHNNYTPGGWDQQNIQDQPLTTYFAPISDNHNEIPSRLFTVLKKACLFIKCEEMFYDHP